MREISAGDMMHVYGSFGMKMDYTVRLCVRMKDEVNAEMLSEAVKNTAKRYPYLSLRLKKDESRLYCDDNPNDVVLLHTNKQISLNSAETNFHIWAVCYQDDVIFLDIYHGLLDGTGMYMVLSTLLYEYCSRRYNVTDHEGVRTLDDEIRPEEAIDPMDYLPEIDLSNISAPARQFGFSLSDDAGLKPAEQNNTDIEISEESFLKFTSANDASPGIMISILYARAIDALYPDRDKDIISSYIINARPMLNALMNHHNCVHTVFLDYSNKIKAMSFDRQCTVYRGKTFVQSDAERVAGTMTYIANSNKAIFNSMPSLDKKCEAFASGLAGGRKLFTFMVSYVGKWKYKAVEKYISEFWTHVPSANALLTEIAAVRGKIFLTVGKTVQDEKIVESLLEELERNKIEYRVVKRAIADHPHFLMPD
ncbi:MAG: hypothetical protein K6F99_00580 [Lachnospiraceae bacterium]|nr:hypothetical protein [Lachnospiraceae bacterium]